MNEKQLETLKKNNKESREFIRSCINYALMILIRTNSIRDITISKLCTVAGVSRTAFYRNYQGVEDVLDDNIKTFAMDISSKIEIDVYKNWITVFEATQKHYKLIETIVESGYDYKIYNVFVSLLPKNEDNRTIQNIWLALFHTMIVKWVKEKNPKKPEEMARLAYKYTKDIPLLSIN